MSQCTRLPLYSVFGLLVYLDVRARHCPSVGDLCMEWRTHLHQDGGPDLVWWAWASVASSLLTVPCLVDAPGVGVVEAPGVGVVEVPR